MSGFTGREVSGTPMETRDLTGQVAREFQNLLGSPNDGAGRIAATFGLDVGELNLTDFATMIMAGGAPGLNEFDEKNREFQQRDVQEANRRLISMFGGAGGRFSENAMEAAGRQTGEMNAQFDRNRFQFAQDRRGQDIAFLANFLQALPQLQAGTYQELGMASNFARPGPPIWQEGWGPGLLSAGGRIGSSFIGR